MATEKKASAPRRTKSEIMASIEDIVVFLRESPGSTSEMMQTAMGVAPGVLDLPLRRAVKLKLVERDGVARASTYRVTGSAKKKFFESRSRE